MAPFNRDAVGSGSDWALEPLTANCLCNAVECWDLRRLLVGAEGYDIADDGGGLFGGDVCWDKSHDKSDGDSIRDIGWPGTLDKTGSKGIQAIFDSGVGSNLRESSGSLDTEMIEV